MHVGKSQRFFWYKSNGYKFISKTNMLENLTNGWVFKPYLFKAWQYKLTLLDELLYCGCTPNIKQRTRIYKGGCFSNPDIKRYVGSKLPKMRIEILQVMTFETDAKILEVGKQESENILKYNTHGRFNMTLGGIPPKELKKWHKEYNYTILMQSAKDLSLKFEYDVREAAVQLGLSIPDIEDQIDGFYSRKKFGWYCQKKYKNTPYPENLTEKTRQGLVHSKPCYAYRVTGELAGAFGSRKELAKFLNVSVQAVCQHLEFPGCSLRGFVVSDTPLTPKEVTEYLTTKNFCSIVNRQIVLINKFEIIQLNAIGNIIATYANTKEAERITNLKLKDNMPFVTTNGDRLVYRKTLV